MSRSVACLLLAVCLLVLSAVTLVVSDDPRPRLLAFACIWGAGYVFRCSMENDPQ